MIKLKSITNWNVVKHNFAETKINEQAMFLVQREKLQMVFLECASNDKPFLLPQLILQWGNS